MNESATSIDLLTALGRLLTDPSLRRAFVQSPGLVASQLRLRDSDLGAFRQLAPDDLHAQARVLVRKRFEAARSHLPLTCSALENGGWPFFEHYAETCWTSRSVEDAYRFALCLQHEKHSISQQEFNRVQFSFKRRLLAIRVIRGHDKRSPALQFLFQLPGRRRHEICLYPSL